VTNLNLDVFVADLERLRSEAETALANAADTEALEAARVVFLGAKNGQLKALQKGLGKLGGEDKPTGGQQFNAVKKIGRRIISAGFSASRGTIKEYKGC
jgi:phenylalanyl-tRNA synthetase alpha chain